MQLLCRRATIDRLRRTASPYRQPITGRHRLAALLLSSEASIRPTHDAEAPIRIARDDSVQADDAGRVH